MNNQEIMTTDVLFNEVIDTLIKEGKLQNIDYALPYRGHEIYDIEYDIYGYLNYGGSEGIYLDLYIDGSFSEDVDEKNQRLSLGTIKTLDDSDRSLREMALLMADFMIESKKFTQKHHYELMRRGYLCGKAGRNPNIITYSIGKSRKYISEGYQVKDLRTGVLWKENGGDQYFCYEGFYFLPIDTLSFEGLSMGILSGYLYYDHTLRFDNTGNDKGRKWNYNSYYDAISGNRAADVFYCFETGKYYCPSYKCLWGFDMKKFIDHSLKRDEEAKRQRSI